MVNLSTLRALTEQLRRIPDGRLVAREGRRLVDGSSALELGTTPEQGHAALETANACFFASDGLQPDGVTWLDRNSGLAGPLHGDAEFLDRTSQNYIQHSVNPGNTVVTDPSANIYSHSQSNLFATLMDIEPESWSPTSGIRVTNARQDIVEVGTAGRILVYYNPVGGGFKWTQFTTAELGDRSGRLQVKVLFDTDNSQVSIYIRKPLWDLFNEEHWGTPRATHAIGDGVERIAVTSSALRINGNGGTSYFGDWKHYRVAGVDYQNNKVDFDCNPSDIDPSTDSGSIESWEDSVGIRYTVQRSEEDESRTEVITRPGMRLNGQNLSWIQFSEASRPKLTNSSGLYELVVAWRSPGQSFDPRRRVVSTEVAGNRGLFLRTEAAKNTYSVLLGDTSGFVQTPTISPVDEAGLHVAWITVSDTDVTFRMDGVEESVDRSALSGDLQANLNPLKVGGYGYGNVNGVSILLDSVAWWHGSLRTTEEKIRIEAAIRENPSWQ